MKFFTAILFASFCATAWSASPIAIREAAASQSQVEELHSKLSPALATAKGRIEALVKAIGQNKETILARIDELKAKIQQLSNNVVDPSTSKFQQFTSRLIKTRLQKALVKLDGLRNKIQQLQ